MTAGEPVTAIVLAGERAGGSALARAEGVAAGVLTDVAGSTCIERVVAALRASRSVGGGLLVGPAAPLPDEDARLHALLETGDYDWLAPAAGPSASAAAALDRLDRFPLLLTAGDHALLTPETIDAFCAAALDRAADVVVGLVPHARVHGAFPQSRRTVLAFSDGHWCGANLFLLARSRARLALEFWRRLERDRKRPWKLAAHLGATTLARYLAGRLARDEAFRIVSARCGAEIDCVPIDDPRAAVDVDSEADLALARQVLSDG